MSFYYALSLFFFDHKRNDKCSRPNFFLRGFSQVNCIMRKLTIKPTPRFSSFNVLEMSLNTAAGAVPKWGRVVVFAVLFPPHLAVDEWMDMCVSVWVSVYARPWDGLPGGPAAKSVAFTCKLYPTSALIAENYGEIPGTRWRSARIFTT